MSVHSILALVAWACIIAAGSWVWAEPNGSTMETVLAADLGKSVQLIGRLGKPITEVVAITGHWENRGFTKASPYVFVVTDVGGRKLNPPAEFNLYVVSLDGTDVDDNKVKLNETWKCKAIELGRFRNVMEKNWELFYEGPVSPPRWGEGPFVSEIILCSRTLKRTPNKK